MSIIGQVKSANSGSQDLVNFLSKIGVVIFLAAWAGLGFLFWSIVSRVKEVAPGERRILVAIGLSTPLLLVRVLYSLLGAFSSDSKFNMLTGNPTTMLVMAVLEEIIICLLCLGTGLTLVKQDYVEYDEDLDSYASYR